MREGRDRTRPRFSPCPECGADPSVVADDELGPETVREVAAWGRLLASTDPAVVRVRPADDVWSALEYAAHVRDLLPVMSDRVERVLREDRSALAGREPEPVVAEKGYGDRVPVLVVEAMSANARRWADALERVGEGEWARSDEPRPGEESTIRDLARLVLHEVIHHRLDAARSADAASRRARPSGREM